MIVLKRSLASLVAIFPMWAMAHAGHDHHSSFWNGFIHPFTGIDHLSMAIALGVLLWTATQRWKMAGLLALATAMIGGFALGHLQLISANTAEYGIVCSLAVLAIALWTKANRLFAVTAMILASFHGMAHGAELGQSGQVAALVLGMVTAMSGIYLFGLGLGALVQKYVPYGKKIVGGLAAVVAIIGFA
ncbi:HupE/UreJ family protein [Acinetobacter sp. CAAS 2-6]|uniref:HupE/UreJ family protein n=1 Tax=Acinetobacter sp. CAAS 2-6 TaxID=3016358 RepID=UPI002DD68558|nr:HupE/UreJ family protein [Acinetobacter sp. CAAS 2-6]